MTVNQFEIAGPGEGPYGVTILDGAVWTTLVHAGAVVRLSADGDLQRIDLESGSSAPSVIVPGPDGALWFTRSGDHSLGRIDPQGARSTVPVASGSPYGLCRGPGGLWFTVMDADRIGRLGADGLLTEFAIDRPGSFPAMITARDDDIWFTLNAGNAIGHWRDGAMTVHDLPTAAAGPVGISAGAETVWFTELLAGQLGRIGAEGDLIEVPLPDRRSKPHAVVATPDGGCWVTLWGSGSLAQIGADGQVVREFGFGPESEPHGLAVADDGSVWVALETGFLAHVEPDRVIA